MTLRQFVSKWKQPYEGNVFQQNFLLLVNTLILLIIIRIFAWFTKSVDENAGLKAVDKFLHLNAATIPLTAFWFIFIRPLTTVQEAQWNHVTKLMSQFVYPWLDKLLPPLYINPNILSLKSENAKSVSMLHAMKTKENEESYLYLTPEQVVAF